MVPDLQTSVEWLTDGEAIALGAVKIASIPHASIIIDGSETEESARNIVSRYQHETATLLNELYQSYKTMSMAAGRSKDVSFELLWKTTAVEHQPYKASIGLYLIVRAIDDDPKEAASSVEALINICSQTLSSQKYEYAAADANEIMQAIQDVSSSRIKGIAKDESIESLQNQLMPSCYAYDRLPKSGSDLSGVVSALAEYPRCALSLQLIPVAYEDAEIGYIERAAQMLGTLSRGVMSQGVGNISFSAADRYAETYRYYSDNKSGSLYLYNILVYGSGADADSIASRLYGQLSLGSDGTTANLKMVDLDGESVQKDRNFYPLPWAVNEMMMECGRNQKIWSSGQFPMEQLYRLPYIITAEEASEFFRLPIGSDRISAGMTINESGKTSRSYAPNIINAGDITIGRLKSSKDTLGFSINDLAKHMLVVGTPGSGKTTFSVGLLDRLWKEHGIPFLVIEPAKNEYRALVQSIPDLQIFTPGKNYISPFVYNPFVPPKNVRLETYKSTLKTAFAAAVSMTTPLDKIFEEAISNCYSDFRWLDSYTSDDKGKIFNISDFVKCFQETFDSIGYTGDARNIGRAGTVRLNGLVKLFDNYYSIPIEDLLSKPTVIELAAIENNEEKALIISLLLLSILAYVNANYVGEGGLKNVILLEEAHVLLDSSLNSGQGDANPSLIAQGLVKRMLAEIRSYGVGIIIADQSPRKVSTDVVGLTDMKVVFRLVESEDKQIIADSTNMSESQAARMSRLKPGEAFVFFNKLEEPEEVVTPDYRLEKNIDITLSDSVIRKLTTYWRGRETLLRPYPQCSYCACCQNGCDYERRLLAKEIARRIFVRNFKPNDAGFEPVKKVFGHISRLVKAELNDEEFSHELLLCTKAQLWRRIRYGTKIPVREIQIENSLRK